MRAPIPSAQLEDRINDFLSRKDRQHPDIKLLEGRHSLPAEDSSDREDAVWFRKNIRALR